MNLDDGMIPAKKRAPWWLYAAAAGVLVILTATLATGTSAPPQPPTQPASQTPAPTEPVQHEISPAAPAPAWLTAVVFLTGWTSTDPQTRTDAFARSALPGLAEGLAVTDHTNVITDPLETIETIAVEPYSAEFKVEFPGRDPVWLLLTNGHGDPDWRVAQVDQRP